eukprot:15445859-Alexandrium_andersonii.AAC.1
MPEASEDEAPEPGPGGERAEEADGATESGTGAVGAPEGPGQRNDTDAEGPVGQRRGARARM